MLLKSYVNCSKWTPHDVNTNLNILLLKHKFVNRFVVGHLCFQ